MTEKKKATLRTISSVDMQLALDWARANELVTGIGNVREKDKNYFCTVELKVSFTKFEFDMKNRFGTFIEVS